MKVSIMCSSTRASESAFLVHVADEHDHGSGFLGEGTSRAVDSRTG